MGRAKGILSPLGQTTKIVIVARGTKGAVYLNGFRAAYFNDADFNVSGYTLLFCESLGRGVCEFDKARVWDLTNLRGLA